MIFTNLFLTTPAAPSAGVFLSDWAFYALLGFLLLTVGFVVWLYARTRSAHTIAELKTRLLELQGQYNAAIHAQEDEARAKLEHLRLILQDLRNHLKAGNAPDMVAARRNEAANFLVLEYAKAVRNHWRLQEPFLNDNRQRYALFLENHILVFLQQAGDIFESLNQPEVLRQAQAQPLTLYRPDFDFAFDALRDYARPLDFGIRRAARLHAKRLGFKS